MEKHFFAFQNKTNIPVSLYFILMTSFFSIWKIFGEGDVLLQFCLFLCLLFFIIISYSGKTIFILGLFALSIFAYSLPMSYGFGKYLLLVAFIITLLRQYNKLDATNLSKILLRVFLLLVVILIQKYRGGSMADLLFTQNIYNIFLILFGYLCLDIKGVMIVLPFIALSGVIVSILNTILPHGVYGIQTGYDVERLIASSFIDPNYYSEVYIPSLASCLVLMIYHRSNRMKEIFYMSCCFVVLFGIMGTASRGALLFSVMMIITAIIYYLKIARSKNRKKVVFIFIATFLFFGLSYYHTPLRKRFLNQNIKEIYLQDFKKEFNRMAIWDDYCTNIIPNNVLFGQGFDWPIHKTILGEKTGKSAHNTFIQIIADFGIVGTIVILFCLSPCVKSYYHLSKKYICCELSSVELFFFLCCLGLIISNILLTGYCDNVAFLFIGFLFRYESVSLPTTAIKQKIKFCGV